MRHLPVIGGLLALASGLAAQPPAGAASATVLGVVFDSVRLRPLVSARVRVDGTDLIASVDGEGRFRLEGIPAGERFLRVEHALLDTLGILLRSATVTFRAGETRVMELATPSQESLVERFCAPAWRARGPAALVGRVREADTDAAAIGAKLSLLWYELETVGNLRRVPRIREATVGPDGMYRVCGLPAELEGKAQVIRGALSSGDVLINFGQDVLALRSLSIAPPGAVVAVQAPAAADTSAGGAVGGAPPVTRLVGAARLTGRVVNRANQPVAGARVQVDGTPRVAVTRPTGEFTLDSLPPGTQTVSVRKLGYSPTESAVDLSSREARTVTLTMDDFVPVLEAVRVTAQRERALDDVGFARRKRLGNGWYMEGDELKNRTALYFSDVLRAAPGLSIQRAGNRQFITSTRDPVNGCVAIWVDGTEWKQLEPGDVDEFVKPHEVAAIEVYSPTTTPAEFQGVNRGSCNAVVVWTVRRLDRRR